MTPRTTQKDVAKAAKVSQGTVSLAFQKNSKITEEVRKRVLQLAEELHYRPDPLLSSLIAYRKSQKPNTYNGTLAWITDIKNQSQSLDHQLYFEGACKQAHKLGYKIEKFSLESKNLNPRRFQDILQSRGIQGLLIPPRGASHGRLKINWKEFSSVTFGYTLHQPTLHMASGHHFRSMVYLIRKLRSLGYRRIGLAINSSLNERVDRNYLGAYLLEQNRFTESNRIPPLLETKLSERSFQSWLQTYKPDVVITESYHPIKKWITPLNLRIPEDIGIAAIARDNKSDFFSGIIEPSEYIGAAAVDLLAGMIQVQEKGVPDFPKRILIQGTWFDGKSLKKITK